jgi:antitoxin component of MazEF toxin-antitoxin module
MVDGPPWLVFSTYMERKLVQVGSSLAVTLPADLVKEFRLQKGQAVEVSVHPTTGAVTIRAGVRQLEDGKVTKRFRGAIDELLDQRAPLYRELAK